MYCSNLSCKFSRQTQKKLVGFSHYRHFSDQRDQRISLSIFLGFEQKLLLALISYCLVKASSLKVNVAKAQESLASTNTKLDIKYVKYNHFLWNDGLLCCPVLNPQITGLPLFPLDPSENESRAQCPIAPLRVKSAGAPTVVNPSYGGAIEKT
jgi:hypothetical protein